MYKRFNNTLLDQLQNCRKGVKIGTSDVTAPTCADDIALISKNQSDAHALTNTIEYASSRHRFVINPTKSELMKFKTINKGGKEVKVHLGPEEIRQVNQTFHLGIERNETNTPDVQKRIATARRTLNALMGSGMHGKNGVSPAISIQLWQTFVIPRLLHGIELLDIRKKDLQDLDLFQRKVLRQLQSLPERTATVAVLGLLEAKPIEGQIDTNILTTFINIAKDPCTIEHQLAPRQLIVKSDQSNSWFIKVKHTLCKYDLPEPMHLLLSIRIEKERLHWKNTIKKKVHDFWHMKNIQEAETKSSLVYMKVQENSVRSPHPIWPYSKSSPTASKKATVKAKLLTDSYRLQIHRARFNKYQINSTCLLCREGEENREHFLSTCTALHEKRTPYIEKPRTILSPDDTSM